MEGSVDVLNENLIFTVTHVAESPGMGRNN